MINLLRANFEEIKRGRSKYVFLLAIVMAIYVLLFEYLVYGNSEVYIDFFIFSGGSIMGLIIASFVGIFIGRDFNIGTIRNKIIFGYSKGKIYLSNLITLIIMCVISYLLYFLIISVVGYFIFDGSIVSIESILFDLFKMILIIIMYVSIFTSISYLLGDLAFSIIANIFYVIIGAGLVSILLSSNVLQESSELIDTSIVDGVYVYTYSENINYVKSKSKRLLYTAVINVFPMGQASEISNGYPAGMVLDKNKNCVILYSIGVSAITTFVGLIIFRRKNIY